MKEEGKYFFKVIIIGAGVIIVAAIVFFDFENMITWVKLNDPFQGQWTVVQLSDGEIIYGRLAGVDGSTIGLRDVYSLDKVAPLPSADAVSSSTGLSVGASVGTAAAQQTFVPVSEAPQLFINRNAVLYFKYVTPDDPALPYLH